jgi:hypothetical protein
MQTSHIRLDPWLGGPRRRKSRLLPLLLLGAACAVTGFTASRQYQTGDWAPTHASELVGKNSTIQPVRQSSDLADSARAASVTVVAKNSAVEPRHAGEEPDLVRKGESASASTAITRAVAPTSNVMVLNPGTADHKGSSRSKATAQVHPRTRLSTRPAHNSISRADLMKTAGDNRPSTSQRGMQIFETLC